MGNANKKSSTGGPQSLSAKKTPDKLIKAVEEESTSELDCCSFSEKIERLIMTTDDEPPGLEFIDTEDDGPALKLDTRVMNVIFLGEINVMFVQQECIKLINSGSKDLHFCKIFN